MFKVPCMPIVADPIGLECQNILWETKASKLCAILDLYLMSSSR